MKYRIYAYFHLVILVLYLIRPVLPYIEYVVNKEYIARNLCINRAEPHSGCEGKCYLEKEIKKSNDTSNDPLEKDSNKKIQNEDVKEFLNSVVSIPKIFETSITHLIIRKIPIITSYVPAIFIPPRLKFIL